MPIPFLIAGAALIAGGYGVKKAVDASNDREAASDNRFKANQLVDTAQESVENIRVETNNSLEKLGVAKLNAYENAIIPFVNSFQRLKNVELKSFEDKSIHIPSEAEMKLIYEQASLASAVVTSGVVGLGAGGLAGLAAYGGATLLASASTGTAISALGGVAATNATLAWFGGGSLAAGGLGMAGGTAVLGGIVAGPVLAIGGMYLAAKAEAELHESYEILAKAKTVASEMNLAGERAKYINTVVTSADRVLNHLLEVFWPLLSGLEKAVAASTDFKSHDKQTQTGIMMAVALVSALSQLLNQRLMTDSGEVDKVGARVVRELGQSHGVSSY
ncbi:hypothetical protein OB952_22315 [Aeromonas salmonicida]|uniref:hypothetical protein n=1 Tax=Aeromonas salmonicida TaxID=645 RepID=UPI00259DC833|nr:hypothetical protein [Aeromonas salmonicida]MDM5070066.1 hypothetical protein [Aeromonas salmonicida]